MNVQLIGEMKHMTKAEQRLEMVNKRWTKQHVVQLECWQITFINTRWSDLSSTLLPSCLFWIMTLGRSCISRHIKPAPVLLWLVSYGWKRLWRGGVSFHETEFVWGKWSRLVRLHCTMLEAVNRDNMLFKLFLITSEFSESVWWSSTALSSNTC